MSNLKPSGRIGAYASRSVSQNPHVRQACGAFGVGVTSGKSAPFHFLSLTKFPPRRSSQHVDMLVADWIEAYELLGEGVIRSYVVWPPLYIVRTSIHLLVIS